MAAPSYKGVGTASSDRGLNGIDLNPAYPSTVDNNDVAIVSIGKHSACSISWPPSGWTSMLDGTNLQVAWRRCDGTEDSSTVNITGTGGTNDAAIANIATYSGCITSGSVVDQSNSGTGTNSPVSITGITTGEVDTLVVFIIGQNNDTTVNTATWACATDPTSLTERYDETSTVGNDCGVATGDASKSSSGATGNASATLAASDSDWEGYLVSLKPPGGGSPDPTVPTPVHSGNFY